MSLVRDIFRRYAGLKSVRALKEELDAAGIVSKSGVDRFGKSRGGKPLARGALYLMLQNCIYRGEIAHKDKAYPGLHEAIVDEALWDMVQAALAENRVERVTRSTATNPSLLAGLVYDSSGERMSPTHANKKGTRYRYYVSQSLIKRGRPQASGEACRVPASDLETIVDDEIIRLMRDEDLIHEVAGSLSVAQRKALITQAAALAECWPSQSPSDRRAIASVLIERVIVDPKEVALTVRLNAIRHITAPDVDIRRLPQSLDGPRRTLSLPARIKRTGVETKLVIQAPFDAILVSAGAPDVPMSLMHQLKVGGRMVIPVGKDPRAQELIRITRTAEDDFQREDIADVRFVPLIGKEGWESEDDGWQVRPPRVVQTRPAVSVSLPGLIAKKAEVFTDLKGANLESLEARIEDARVVLIGEATHGTSEFYRMRARITRQLIQSKGFNIVAVEADWPDAARIDHYVRHRDVPRSEWTAFARFPTWMWRNQETRTFADWLHKRNATLEYGNRTAF